MPKPQPQPRIAGAVLDELCTIVRCDIPLDMGIAYRVVRMPDGSVRLVGNDDGTRYVTVAADEITSVTVVDASVWRKRTPTWAIVVGVLGLFVFLIGALFFLVKESYQVPGSMVTIQTTRGVIAVNLVNVPVAVAHAKFT